MDTFALLNKTESALKESKATCEALEEKLEEQLAARDQRHQKELSERKESFRRSFLRGNASSKKASSFRFAISAHVLV